jgi:N utilization substance protein B
MSAATARRRARERVLLGLYERQLAGNADDAIAADLFAPAAGVTGRESLQDTGDLPFDDVYAKALWRGVSTEYDGLLRSIEPALDRKLAALAPVERAVLVIGAWELVHRVEIPYRVVIDEAVELAKTYGGTDGHKFVNGVLDKLAPALRAVDVNVPAADE